METFLSMGGIRKDLCYNHWVVIITNEIMELEGGGG